MSRNTLLLTFAACALMCGSARAEADIGLMAAGVSIGIVSPEDMDATFGLGVFADLGTLTPQLRLEPRVDYWQQSEEVFGGGEVSARAPSTSSRSPRRR